MGQAESLYPERDSLPGGRALRRSARAVLVVWIGVRLGMVLSDASISPWPPLTLSILRGTPQLLQWCREIAALVILEAAQSLLLGVLMALSMGQGGARLRTRQVLLAYLYACGLSGLLQSVAVLGRPRDWDLILIAGSTAIGVWLGAAVSGGWRGILRLIPQSLVIGLLAGVGMMFAYEKLISESAILPDPQAVSMQTKRSLLKRLRNELNRPGQERHATRIELSQADLDALTDWLAASHRIPVVVAVRMRLGQLEVLSTTPVKFFAGGHLNVRLLIQMELTQSILKWRVVGCQVGRVALPAQTMDDLLRPLVGELLVIPEVQAVRESLHGLAISERTLVVDGARDQLRQSLLPLLRSESQPADNQRRRIRDYCRRVEELADSLPEGDRKLTVLLQSLFLMADRRSAAADPVQENRSALLALAYLLGPEPVTTLIGPVLSPSERVGIARRLEPITIRGRQDLPQHVMISCAVALLSNEQISAILGLWKERLDADNGSGFSFVDLMADCVGLRLAELATRDRASALLLQYRLRRDWKPSDLFPPIDGLPEQISRSEFDRRFGGGRGTAFERLEREIQTRIQNCYILR